MSVILLTNNFVLMVALYVYKKHIYYEKQDLYI